MGQRVLLVTLALLASTVHVCPSPIAGAVVYWKPMNQRDIVLPNWFRFPRQAWSRSATSSRLVSGVSVSAAESDAASPAVQSARVTGRVTDTMGVPIPGATVTTVPANGGVARRVLSRPDGTYDVDGIAEGSYFVDFELTGFDPARRNHVRPTVKAPAYADAVLYVSAMCECVTVMPKQGLQDRVGQVLSASGHPLPHASLHVDGPHPDFGVADGEGRFAVHLPLNASVALTASESGFKAVTQQVSGATGQPIVFRLVPGGRAGVPETERLRGPCCPGAIFLSGR